MIANARMNDTVAREVRVEEMSQQALPDGSEQDAESGDPDLDRADEPDGIVHQLDGGRRSAAALVSELDESNSPRCDQRVLGDHEERVSRNEQENDDDAEWVAHAPSASAQVLGMSAVQP